MLAADPVALASVTVAVAAEDPALPVGVAAALPAVAHAPNPTVAAVYALPTASNALEHTLLLAWITLMRSEEVQVEWQRHGIAESWIAVWPVVHWQT